MGVILAAEGDAFIHEIAEIVIQELSRDMVSVSDVAEALLPVRSRQQNAALFYRHLSQDSAPWRMRTCTPRNQISIAIACARHDGQIRDRQNESSICRRRALP